MPQVRVCVYRKPYSTQELMIIAAAREIHDGEVVFVGMRLPIMSFGVARLVGVTQQGEINAVNSSVRSDDVEAVRHSVDFAGRKILVLFDPGTDLIKVGMQQTLLVGFLGLLLTAMILGGMYYFMRSSRRLASEIATSNLMKASLELLNRELIHRVGNLLAVAQGIIRLSYDASLSTLEFRDSTLDRLHALHQSVGLINREDWKWSVAA